MDAIKAFGGIVLALGLFIGFNVLTNAAPEPVRNIIDSPAPLLSAVREAVDGVTSDAEDEFVKAAKRSTMFALEPANRAEMIEMGRWLCQTDSQYRMTVMEASYPEAPRSDIAMFETMNLELEGAAIASGLCNS